MSPTLPVSSLKLIPPKDIPFLRSTCHLLPLPSELTSALRWSQIKGVTQLKILLLITMVLRRKGFEAQPPWPAQCLKRTGLDRRAGLLSLIKTDTQPGSLWCLLPPKFLGALKVKPRKPQRPQLSIEKPAWPWDQLAWDFGSSTCQLCDSAAASSPRNGDHP